MKHPPPEHCTGRPTGRAVALALVCGVASSPLLAQSSGGIYEIPRYSVDAGGETSAGGNYTLTGSIGQAEAASASAEGSVYSLTGGLLARGRLRESNIDLFSDGFE